MADAKKIESAIRRVRNQKAFIEDLLIDALGWDIDQQAAGVEKIGCERSAAELRAEGLEEHLVEGTIRQIRLSKGSPWGIFLLDFKNPDAFLAGRGTTGTLRNVLRWLVPSRRKRSTLAAFRNENLLFICNHDYQHYRFAHFRTTDNKGRTAPLATFGWNPDDPLRALCEYNLNALEWPATALDAQGWIEAWSRAFDVEKLTRRFYEDYAIVFARVEKLIGQHCCPHTPCAKDGTRRVPTTLETGTRRMPAALPGDGLRMFTQTLFNRLMFLRFMECKGWLTFGGEKHYLRALYAAHGSPHAPCAETGTRRVPTTNQKSFYQGRLCPLFFEGLAIQGKQQSEAYGQVLCLNGGLFERSELDKQVTDLPDEVFAGILADEPAGGLFYRHNFTVEESTPLDIEVAVDPEMLGKVFEELVTGRHESGAYYTPRPVVSFMCREALKGYLCDKLLPSFSGRGAGGEGVGALAVTTLVDRHDASGLQETHVREIVAALDDLKAVDPACGSGAYLLGLLQEMLVLYRLLYGRKLVKDARTPYDLKLRIISRSLYGVDLDPFATSIARLRLWLSLAVEADKPAPLPNLDFKIETGDSLLGPDPQDLPDLLRAKLQRAADVAALVKSRFFLSHGEEKDACRKTIIDHESRLRKGLAAEYGEGVVDWRIRFAEAFAAGRDGFDVVLANPPYVRKENIDKASKPALRALYGDAVTGQSDLFCYFHVRALQLLRPGGMHVFICSNSWLDSGYGAALQGFLLRSSHVQAVYDSAVERQFVTADVNTIISVLRKGPPSSDAATRFVSLRAPFDEALARSDGRREIAVAQQDLWQRGLAVDKAGRPAYAGNKWGGKYLRAPDVYHAAFERGRSVLTRLGACADIHGYIHDNNTGSRFPPVDFLKSVKHAETIQIGRHSPGVVRCGVKEEGNSRLAASILFPRTFGARHVVVWNPEGVLGKEFYKIIIESPELALSVAAQLNSTLGILQREILGLVNLGDGAIKFSAADVAMFEVIESLPRSKIASPFLSLATRPLLDIADELKQPDRARSTARSSTVLALRRTSETRSTAPRAGS